MLANPDEIEVPIAQIAAGQVLVADVNNAIVGFAVVLPRGDGEVELDGLFVEPDQWRMGIGRALLNRVVDGARANGAHTVHVIGNPHASHFYVANGFDQTGTTTTQFGEGLLLHKLI